MKRKTSVSSRSPKAKVNRTRKANLELLNLIESLRGSCKGDESLVDALHRGRQEKSFCERRLEDGCGKPRRLVRPIAKG
jgi:hypothetical protein